MKGVNPALSEKYAQIIKFLSDNPAMASASRSKSAAQVGSKEYIQLQAVSFSKSREPKQPDPPQTIPDEMVGVILNQYFGLPKDKLEDAKHWHLLSMGAENIVGDILERYIASVLEPEGWAWCSGSLVKAVDFIFQTDDKTWVPLQVKNRDNSENSSSSAIRDGTTIKKWHRSFSKKKGDNWDNFPVKGKLSEKGFREFVDKYLAALKKISSGKM